MEEGGFRKYPNGHNSLQKALYLEKCIGNINENVEKILRVLDDEDEFDGWAYNILYSIHKVKQIMEDNLIFDFDPTNCGAIDETMN